MYSLEPKTKFRRDLKRLKKRNWDLALLANATDLLIEHGELPEAYETHSLRGDFKGCIDAHIRPDWF